MKPAPSREAVVLSINNALANLLGVSALSSAEHAAAAAERLDRGAVAGQEEGELTNARSLLAVFLGCP
jgi:hypothetical protein